MLSIRMESRTCVVLGDCVLATLNPACAYYRHSFDVIMLSLTALLRSEAKAISYQFDCSELLRYYGRVSILIPRFLQQRFARINLFALILIVVPIAVAERFFSSKLGIDGPFGGWASWLAGGLNLGIFVFFFVRYISEYNAARRTLLEHKLPCPKCGHPLLNVGSGVCSECGRAFVRKDVIEYWKNLHLIDMEWCDWDLVEESQGEHR